MISLHDLAYTIILFIPAMVSNGSATLISRGRPLDLGKFFIDGRRILGDGKTLEGFFLGLYYGVSFVITIGVIKEDPGLIELGLGSCLGALIGDIIGSFIKRRLGMERGKKAPILDQLDFAIGATLFMMLLGARLAFVNLIIVYILIYILHVYTNKLAYYLGLKNVPW